MWHHRTLIALGTLAVLIAFHTAVSSVPAQDESPEMRQFQGQWQVIELVEDGKVIPKQAIAEWLPSGGRAEIIDSAIIFKSPNDGKKYVKVFSVTATVYPKQIEINTPKRKDSWGIYRFDEARLVICLADPAEVPRPMDFSARAGSKRMLMVLRRMSAKESAASPPAKTTPKPQQSGQAGRLLTDNEVAKMLPGTWKLSDSAGSLYITFNAHGTFSTVREYQQLRLFHKSFVQTPISTGTWGVKNGTLTAHVTTSVRFDRVNHLFAFAIRSISSRDMIFVDQLGRVGSAVRIR